MWANLCAPLVPTIIITKVKLENIARLVCETNQKENDATSEVRQLVGQKLHKIWVRLGGDINGRCDGKNAWDETIRTLIPQILDINVMEWEGHKLESLDKLKAGLDKEFEYMDNELSLVGFRNVVKRWLKT